MQCGIQRERERERERGKDEVESSPREIDNLYPDAKFMEAEK